MSAMETKPSPTGGFDFETVVNADVDSSAAGQLHIGSVCPEKPVNAHKAVFPTVHSKGSDLSAR